MRASGDASSAAAAWECSGAFQFTDVATVRDAWVRTYGPARDCLTGGKLPPAVSLSTTRMGLLVTSPGLSRFATHAVTPPARPIITRGTA